MSKLPRSDFCYFWVNRDILWYYSAPIVVWCMNSTGGQCCQILREKQASRPMKTSLKQATSPFVVKKKKETERLLHFAYTQISTWIQKYHCIHYCFYMLWPFYFSSRTSKQYDMQYNRKRNTLPTSPKTCNYIYKRLYIKTSPMSLIISRLVNCAGGIFLNTAPPCWVASCVTRGRFHCPGLAFTVIVTLNNSYTNQR